MLEWLVLAVVGQVLIYVFMKFQLPFKSEWFEKLHQCNLCSGVWIFGILALAFSVDIFSESFGVADNVIGKLVTGAVTSYLVHVFVIGWKAKHEVVVI